MATDESADTTSDDNTDPSSTDEIIGDALRAILEIPFAVHPNTASPTLNHDPILSEWNKIQLTNVMMHRITWCEHVNVQTFMINTMLRQAGTKVIVINKT